MKALKSLKDALDVYGTGCKECGQVFSGVYDDIQRTGDTVSFLCSRFGIHRLRAEVGFETSPEEIRELGAEIVNFVKMNGSDLTESKIRDIRQELSKLNRKLAVYATFLPEDTVMSLRLLLHLPEGSAPACE